MPATTPDELFALLGRLGIPVETVEHPPLRTVEDARAHRPAGEPGHTKNLFLKDRKGALFLVVAGEDARLDLKRLHEPLGAAGRLSFGSAELLGETLGVVPGAVTAFAPVNDTAGRVAVVIEAALMDEPVLHCHPLVNTMTTAVRREDLVRFLEWTGHPPRVLALQTAAEAAAAQD